MPFRSPNVCLTRSGFKTSPRIPYIKDHLGSVAPVKLTLRNNHTKALTFVGISIARIGFDKIFSHEIGCNGIPKVCFKTLVTLIIKLHNSSNI